MSLTPFHTESPIMAGLILILAIILLVIVSPLATIWALNTLFALAIPYTGLTWLAALWLTLAVSGARSND